jgi:hypothetical protein
MALKRLFSEEMLQLSGTWVDPKSKAHKALLASPDLAPAMPRLTTTHNQLATLAQPVSEDPRVAAIMDEQSRLDPRHDDIVRGGYGLLTSAAFLLGGEEGAELLKLRDLLFPDGLSLILKTYRGEAGTAAQLEKRLTPEVRAQLASISVGAKGQKKTLEHFVDELLAVGAKLGALEDEKAILQPSPGEPGTGAGAALLAARNQWVRVVNALVANNELAALDPEEDKLIFGSLRAAEKASDRREGSAAKKKADAGGGEPEKAGAAAAVPVDADVPPKK